MTPPFAGLDKTFRTLMIAAPFVGLTYWLISLLPPLLGGPIVFALLMWPLLFVRRKKA